MIAPMRHCCVNGYYLVWTKLGIRRICESCRKQRGPTVSRVLVKLQSFEREHMRSIA